jgi:hypothetical protein
LSPHFDHGDDDVVADHNSLSRFRDSKHIQHTAPTGGFMEAFAALF